MNERMRRSTGIFAGSSAEASMKMEAEWVRETRETQFDLERLKRFVGEAAISRASHASATIDASS